jgi:hypothetical protein
LETATLANVIPSAVTLLKEETQLIGSALEEKLSPELSTWEQALPNAWIVLFRL